MNVCKIDDEEMFRMIANPRRLKPVKQPDTIKPTFHTKLRYFLRDVYPDMYISDTLVSMVRDDIGKRIKDEVTGLLIHEFVDNMIQQVLNENLDLEIPTELSD